MSVTSAANEVHGERDENLPAAQFNRPLVEDRDAPARGNTAASSSSTIRPGPRGFRSESSTTSDDTDALLEEFANSRRPAQAGTTATDSRLTSGEFLGAASSGANERSVSAASSNSDALHEDFANSRRDYNPDPPAGSSSNDGEPPTVTTNTIIQPAQSRCNYCLGEFAFPEDYPDTAPIHAIMKKLHALRYEKKVAGFLTEPHTVPTFADSLSAGAEDGEILMRIPFRGEDWGRMVPGFDWGPVDNPRMYYADISITNMGGWSWTTNPADGSDMPEHFECDVTLKYVHLDTSRLGFKGVGEGNLNASFPALFSPYGVMTRLVDGKTIETLPMDALGARPFDDRLSFEDLERSIRSSQWVERHSESAERCIGEMREWFLGVRNLPCNHAYHEVCIDSWRDQNTHERAWDNPRILIERVACAVCRREHLRDIELRRTESEMTGANGVGGGCGHDHGHSHGHGGTANH